MVLFRAFGLVLLVYVTADFLDPSIPGVFFFDTEVFFVDGVVQMKADPIGKTPWRAES